MNSPRDKRRWYQLTLRSFLVLCVLAAFGLGYVWPKLWTYMSVPRPLVCATLAAGVEPNIVIHAKVFEVGPGELNKLGIDPTSVPAAAVHVSEDNDANVQSIDAAHKRGQAKLIAEPQLFTVSGVPVTFSAKVRLPDRDPKNSVLRQFVGKQSPIKIDMVPIALGNGSIRLEIRPQLGRTRGGQNWVDTPVELKPNQAVVVVARLPSDSTSGPTTGLVVLAKPTHLRVESPRGAFVGIPRSH